MELKDYWLVVKHRWISIVVCLVLCLGASVAVTALLTPAYESSARVLVSASNQDSNKNAYQGGLLVGQRLGSYATIGQSLELARAVGQRVDLDPRAVRALSDKVTTTVEPGTTILVFTVTDESPTRAQMLAQVYVEEFQTLVEEIEGSPAQGEGPLKLTLIDPASLPDEPISPEPLKNYGSAALLGLLIGLAVALVREIFDKTVKTPQQAAEPCRAPVIGRIGRDPREPADEPIQAQDSHSATAEAYAVLRTNLQFRGAPGAGAGRVYVVASPSSQTGAAATTANLALAFARAGEPVALVEGDLRSPQMTAVLGLDDGPGLASVLVGHSSLAEALRTEPETGLAVLPSGEVPHNPSELLQSDAMRQLITELREKFAYIILSAPPLLPLTDAAVLGARADGVLVEVQHGRTQKELLREAADRLAAVDANLIGVVYTNAPTHSSGRGHTPRGRLGRASAHG